MKKVYSIIILCFLMVNCSSDDSDTNSEQLNKPIIDNISVNSARIGDTIIISGKNFNSNETYVVKFNGIVGLIIEVIPTQLKVEIPENATSGEIVLILNNEEIDLGAIEILLKENLIDKLNESRNKWTELKKENGNSYIYETTFLSFAGFGNTTELKVIDNKVTSRIYKGFSIDEQTGERITTDSYSENEDELGSHEKGALPLTIDELYNSCASDYLIVDEENNTLYFETDINGLMTLCGFLPKEACSDDCFLGISIDSFDWID